VVFRAGQRTRGRHLGQLRHQVEVVEYRVEQHAAKLREQLEALRGAG
jgi:hypothetical protein